MDQRSTGNFDSMRTSHVQDTQCIGVSMCPTLPLYDCAKEPFLLCGFPTFICMRARDFQRIADVPALVVEPWAMDDADSYYSAWSMLFFHERNI